MLTEALLPSPVTPSPVQAYTTLKFFFVLKAPGVAVRLTGSPGKMAGALALQARVTGGAFLQPMGMKAIHADARTMQDDFNNRESMRLSSAIRLKFLPAWMAYAPHFRWFFRFLLLLLLLRTAKAGVVFAVALPSGPIFRRMRRRQQIYHCTGFCT